MYKKHCFYQKIEGIIVLVLIVWKGKRKNMKKKRTGILGVLLAVLALGIGYAAVNAITLTITGSGTITSTDANFKVEYTNVAVADLCFQMFAEVEDIDQLLDMIKSSTDLRDHIKFN